MNLKCIDFGCSKETRFDISVIGRKHWQNIIETIIEESFSPSAVLDDSTSVRITIRDNHAKINVQHKADKFVERNYNINEFGCVEEDYIVQSYLQVFQVFLLLFGTDDSLHSLQCGELGLQASPFRQVCVRACLKVSFEML